MICAANTGGTCSRLFPILRSCLDVAPPAGGGRGDKAWCRVRQKCQSQISGVCYTNKAGYVYQRTSIFERVLRDPPGSRIERCKSSRDKAIHGSYCIRTLLQCAGDVRSSDRRDTLDSRILDKSRKWRSIHLSSKLFYISSGKAFHESRAL
jgi:hypothetical protein